MKILLIILIVTRIFACNTPNEMEKKFNLNVGIEFSVLNSQNLDLLDPNIQNHLDTKNIKLLYVINKEKREVNNPNMDFPKNLKIYKHENEYRISVLPNYAETSEKSITYIQWSQNDTDTIEVTTKQNKHSICRDKIWLNGRLVWKRGTNKIQPYFVLRK